MRTRIIMETNVSVKKNIFNPMNKAFLFDLDGTLIDTMHWHFKTWEVVVAELGSPLKGAALMLSLIHI